MTGAREQAEPLGEGWEHIGGGWLVRIGEDGFAEDMQAPVPQEWQNGPFGDWTRLDAHGQVAFHEYFPGSYEADQYLDAQTPRAQAEQDAHEAALELHELRTEDPVAYVAWNGNPPIDPVRKAELETEIRQANQMAADLDTAAQHAAAQAAVGEAVAEAPADDDADGWP